METHSALDSLSSTSPLDTMASSQPPASFLKLEDLHSSPAPSTHDDVSAGSQASPAPVVVHSKPAKKRKSWGQELPQPKTSLPPRKRAKTDDEKEQRRIERIKRNRAAAHNSRERKRQETETLAVALARANAELDAYRKLHGPLPDNVVLPEVTLSTEADGTPAPSLVGSQDTNDADSPASPADNLFDSPDVTIKQEPTDSAFPSTLSPSNLSPTLLSGKQQYPTSLLPPLDLTQHSAAMLCDLQCRSILRWRTRCGATPSTPSQANTSWWTFLFLYLTSLQLQSTYKTLALALFWTPLSPLARTMARRTTTPPSPPRSTSLSMTSSTIPRPRSTSALAQLNAATAGVDRRPGAPAALPRHLSEMMDLRSRHGAVVLGAAGLARSSPTSLAGQKQGLDRDGLVEMDVGVELEGETMEERDMKSTRG